MNSTLGSVVPLAMFLIIVRFLSSTESDPEKGGGREAGGFEQGHLQNQSQAGGAKVNKMMKMTLAHVIIVRI